MNLKTLIAAFTLLGLFFTSITSFAETPAVGSEEARKISQERIDWAIETAEGDAKIHMRQLDDFFTHMVEGNRMEVVKMIGDSLQHAAIALLPEFHERMTAMDNPDLLRPDMRAGIERIVVEDNLAFIMRRSDFPTELISADVVLYENNTYVVHWDMFQYRKEKDSGVNMWSGLTEYSEAPKASKEQRAANKHLVRTFLTLAYRGENVADVVNQHVSASYLDHSYERPDDRAGLIEFFETQGQSIHIWHMAAQNDLVAVLARLDSDDETQISSMYFRIEGGKIAEHWQASQTVGEEYFTGEIFAVPAAPVE